MTRQRMALLAVVLLLLMVCAGWGLMPTTEVSPRAQLEPELREEAVRVVARAEVEPVDEDEAPEPVECALWRTLGDTTEIQLDEVDPETLESLGWLFPERLPKAMRFTPRRSVGLGWLHITGHEPAVVSWAAGSCLDFVEMEEHEKVTVSGRVTGVAETGAVSVGAMCDDVLTGFDSPQPPEALFEVRFPADAQACELNVRRVFGGRDLVATYPVDVRDQEGLELAVAEAAGIEMMDLVVSVDGEPAADLVADELIEEEGPLVLEVLRGEERFEVTVQ